jgi:hypothetical protein
VSTVVVVLDSTAGATVVFVAVVVVVDCVVPDVDDVDVDVFPVLIAMVGIRDAAALGRETETRFVVVGRWTTFAAGASDIIANATTIMPQMFLVKIPFWFIILI